MTSSMGKYLFGFAKVGERGQIVIPKNARDCFGIKPGDRMMVLRKGESCGITLINVTECRK